jgi:hypothetical protein
VGLRHAGAFLSLLALSGARTISLVRMQMVDVRLVDASEDTASAGLGAALWTRAELKVGRSKGVARQHAILLLPHRDASRCCLVAVAQYYEACCQFEDTAAAAAATATAQQRKQRKQLRFAAVDHDGSIVDERLAAGRQRADALRSQGRALLWSFGFRRVAGQTETSFGVALGRRVLAYGMVAALASGAPLLFSARGGSRSLHSLRAYVVNELSAAGFHESIVSDYVGWLERHRSTMARSYSSAKWRALGSRAGLHLAGRGGGQPADPVWSRWSLLPSTVMLGRGGYFAGVVWLMQEQQELG